MIKSNILISFISKRHLFQLLENLPLALPAGLAVFSFVVIILLIMGQLQSYLVLLIAIPSAGLTFFLLSKNVIINRPGSVKEKRVIDLAACVFVVAWIFFNALYTAQNVFVYRDPAVYTVASEWLVKNKNLEINTTSAFENNPAVTAESAGYESTDGNPTRVYAQGLHLLPTLSGLFGRLMGSSTLMRINALIGGLALLSLYGYARLLMKPHWALMAPVIVGLCLPMIYFSRDMYTEALTLSFVFGSLSLLWVAETTKNSKGYIWLLAGVTLGAGSLVRLDLFIPMAVMAIYIYIKILTVNKKSRAIIMKQSALLFGGTLLVALVGWLDLVLLSKTTYLNIKDSITFIATGMFALFIVLCCLTAIFLRYDDLFKKTKSFVSNYYLIAVSILGLISLTLVLTRPYWHKEGMDYSAKTISGKQAIIASSATSQSLPSENILLWLVWYIGFPITILGCAGLFYAAIQAKQKNRLLLLPGVFIVVSVALVYLIAPSITPDHIWASRRFLPIVIPGLVIYGLFITAKVFESKWLKSKGYKHILEILTASFLIIGPLVTTLPFTKTRIYTGQLHQILTVCATLPVNPVLLWAGNMRFETLQTTRSYCGVESMGLQATDRYSLSEVAKQAYASNLTPVMGITTSDLAYLGYNYNDFTEVSSLNSEDIEKSFRKPPKSTVMSHRTILMATINQDGTLSPLKN